MFSLVPFCFIFLLKLELISLARMAWARRPRATPVSSSSVVGSEPPCPPSPHPWLLMWTLGIQTQDLPHAYTPSALLTKAPLQPLSSEGYGAERSSNRYCHVLQLTNQGTCPQMARAPKAGPDPRRDLQQRDERLCGRETQRKERTNTGLCEQGRQSPGGSRKVWL